MWADDLELFDPAQRPRVNTGEAWCSCSHGAARRAQFAKPQHLFLRSRARLRSPRGADLRAQRQARQGAVPRHRPQPRVSVPRGADGYCGAGDLRGQYLGTLFSGQVLTEPPTAEGFARVAKHLGTSRTSIMARLEEAYYRVPVVTTAQLAEMVRMLEVFARYLSNAWKRLEIMSEFQQVREREARARPAGTCRKAAVVACGSRHRGSARPGAQCRPGAFT